MRAYSPRVREALRWFERTHELQVTAGRPWWRLAWLPVAGGIGQQDAWLWDALTFLLRVHGQLLNEELERRHERRQKHRSRHQGAESDRAGAR